MLSGRGLDHLIEQNETDLCFISAYGGGESPEELLRLVSQSICDGIQVTAVEHGVQFKLEAVNLTLVNSDIHRRGFLNGELSETGV